MASSVTQTEVISPAPKPLLIPTKLVAPSQNTDSYVPLRPSSALKPFKHNDLTPAIGTLFENINLTEILHSPACDQIVKDIAITSKSYQCNPVYDVIPRLYGKPLALFLYG